MELDRQTIMAVGIAVFGMLMVAATILGPTSRDPAVDVSERAAYSKDDVRYTYQQADIKEAKKHPKRAPKKTGPEKFVTDGSTSSGSSGGSDDSGDSGEDPNEEPSVFDHDAQEEPPNND